MIDEKKLMTEINNFYYDKVFDGKYTVSEVFAHIMTIIGSQPEKGDWIPCNKEIPTEKGYYQTTVYRNGNVGYEVFDLWWQDGMWFVDEGKEMFIHAVVAWMPLPEPYSEEDK